MSDQMREVTQTNGSLCKELCLNQLAIVEIVGKFIAKGEKIQQRSKEK